MLVCLQKYYPQEFYIKLAERFGLKQISFFDGSATNPKTISVRNVELNILPLHYNYVTNLKRSDRPKIDFTLEFNLRTYIFRHYQILYEMLTRSELYLPYGYFEVTRIIDAVLAHWVTYLKKNKISIIISKIPDNIDNYIIYLISRFYKISYLYIHHMPDTSVDGKSVIISRDLYSLDTNYLKLTEKTNINNKSQFMSFEKIEIYTPSKGLLTFSIQSKFTNITRDPKILFNISLNIIRYLKNKFFLLPSQNRFLLKLPREIPKKNKIYYFPMQVQPEASTIPHAYDFRDTLKTIIELSRCLIDDEVLLVKEHPAYINNNRLPKYNINDYRNKDIYKMISDIDNVYFINPLVSSKLILEKSDVLICYPGSTILEAVKMNKKVLLLGRHIYSSFPGVLMISESLDKTISHLRTNKNNKSGGVDLADLDKLIINLNYEINCEILDSESQERLVESLFFISENHNKN
jgi:hypothetical protein